MLKADQYPFLTICQLRKLSEYEGKNKNIINTVRLWYDYRKHYELISKKYPEHKFFKDVDKVNGGPKSDKSGGSGKATDKNGSSGQIKGVQSILF